jgi:hypothetical protein
MSSEKPINKVLDIKEAVAFFNGHISEWMIRQLVNSKEIPHFRQGSKKLLFDADALELWWSNRINQSIQPEKPDNSGYGTIRKINV